METGDLQKTAYDQYCGDKNGGERFQTCFFSAAHKKMFLINKDAKYPGREVKSVDLGQERKQDLFFQ